MGSFLVCLDAESHPSVLSDPAIQPFKGNAVFAQWVHELVRQTARTTGHFFQGRFKGELIEDVTYFWTVSRYVHLNPIRGNNRLVDHPLDWAWSSYGGYANKEARLHWLGYDHVYSAWHGEMGGSNAESAYKRFVESGLDSPPANPFAAAEEGRL